MTSNKSFTLIVFVVLVTFSLKFKSIGAVTSRFTHGKLVVCYLTSSSIHRPSRGSFDIDDVDPTLCTHIVYGHAGLSVTDDGIISMDPLQDFAREYGNRGYERVVGLKESHPHLKVTLSVGGWNQSFANFSLIARDPEKRSRFVANAVQFVRQYNFDGLDINWQFLDESGSARDDKLNLLLLVKELRLACNQHNLLLTAVLATLRGGVDNGYNIRELSNNLDYIHYQFVNYIEDWDYSTNAHVPFRSSDVGNVEYMVNYLIDLGASPSKLIIGIPFFGKTFRVVDEAVEENLQNLRLGYPAKCYGFKGPFTNNSDFMGYNEVCLELQNESAGFKTYWDEKSQTPFAVSGEKVISYDNERSISKKVEFAMEKNLGGVMVWSIDTDDFKGDCGTGKYPLLTSINRDIEDFFDIWRSKKYVITYVLFNVDDSNLNNGIN